MNVVIFADFPQIFHFLSSYQTFSTSSFICLGGTTTLCHIKSGPCKILKFILLDYLRQRKSLVYLFVINLLKLTPPPFLSAIKLPTIASPSSSDITSLSSGGFVQLVSLYADDVLIYISKVDIFIATLVPKLNIFGLFVLRTDLNYMCVYINLIYTQVTNLAAMQLHFSLTLTP